MKWLEVSVRTSPEFEEDVSEILYELGANGLSIDDPNDIVDMKEEQEAKDWDFIDEKLLDLNLEEIYISAYFSECEDIEAIKEAAVNKIEKNPYMRDGKRFGNVNFEYVEDRDWSEVWKKGYKPMRVGEKIVIKPSWENFESEESDIVVELDPGMAFGTGDHETTYMCAEAIESYLEEEDLVYDIGCGSGILGIVAAKLGARKVIGIDLDPVSVKVSKDNVDINRENERVEIIHGNLLDVIDKSKKADLIVANIIAEVIYELADVLDDYLKIDGIFIASGIILSKVDRLVEKFEENNFKILEVNTKGEWASMVVKR